MVLYPNCLHLVFVTLLHHHSVSEKQSDKVVEEAKVEGKNRMKKTWFVRSGKESILSTLCSQGSQCSVT